MKKIFITTVFTALIVFAYSQTDSTLVNKLNKSFEKCENIAFNSQELIPKYDISQYDSITAILNIWEKYCGESEPIERVKILIDIHRKTFVDTVYKKYITDYANNYTERVNYSKEEDYRKIFDYNKVYYDYVPFRSEFDKWTKANAEELIKGQKEGTSEYIFCLLFIDEFDKVQEELKKKEYKDNFIKNTVDEIKTDYYKNIMSVSVLFGAIMPVGKLSTSFKTNSMIGVRFGKSVYDDYRLELGFKITPMKECYLPVMRNDSIKQAQADLNITMGAWFMKDFRIIGRFYIDAVASAGINITSTDLHTGEFDSEGNAETFDFYTLDTSVGINLRQTIFTKSNIGLNFSYHFIPFFVDEDLAKNIGSQFVSVSLFYRH